MGLVGMPLRFRSGVLRGLRDARFACTTRHILGRAGHDHADTLRAQISSRSLNHLRDGGARHRSEVTRVHNLFNAREVLGKCRVVRVFGNVAVILVDRWASPQHATAA